MTQPVVFYDIPGNAHPQKAWSPNTQNTRYILNYKGIPYKTVWVEYPDIVALAKKLGAKHTDLKEGKPWYTVPIIHDPNTNAVVSDSFDIAQYLDKQYPSTPRVLQAGTDALQAVFHDSFLKEQFGPHLFPIIVAAINKQLNPPSENYFRSTREAWLGGKLEEIRPAGPTRESAYKESKAAFDQLSTVLDKNGQGSFFALPGDSIAFVDFVIGSHLWFFKLMVSEQEWKEFASWNGGRWAKLVNALSKWENGVGDESEVWKPE